MNDMILNMLANDSFTVSDFEAAGLSAENTKLESEDRYLQSQMIQENPTFHTDGVFDKDKFHQYYLHATAFYNNLADDTYIENIEKNTFYSKDNMFAPVGSKTIDETPVFVASPNPFLQNNSITRVGKKGDRTLSISEIAQSQKIYDSKNGEFKDESVNDRAFGNNAFKWLGDLFSEPLVIAQWDEDGEHIDPLTGETKTHKKGDYKYNDDGTFYYETLNGRDVYGKQVLNRMNTLTVDGSVANRYDFFDSDDLGQKSFIGSTLKNLALVGSMFLPVVGKPIIAASIATQSVGLLGALGKMFLGSENETINNLHGWAKTVNRQSSSEYASQNTWCWENMINMIGDTVGQLAEQRFLFTHVPALLKGTKGIKASRNTKTYEQLVKEGAEKIEKQTKSSLDEAIKAIKANSRDDYMAQVTELGQQWKTAAHLKSAAALEKYMKDYRELGSIMSKAYMTGITVQDTYGEAKANGASDLEAFALTLGYAAGEAWILNTGLGEWIMPELQGEKLKYRAVINALKNEVKPLSKEAIETTTKEGRQNLFKKIFNIGKRIATDDYARSEFASKTLNPMKVVLAHAAGEGFEEVSEEVLADFSKTAFNTVNWLRGDETRIAGAWENMGDRYGMSLLGGFLGGGISSVSTDFSQAQQLAKMNKESAIQEIIYMINNDKIDDFLKYANKADLGSKHLQFAIDENGNYKPGTKENNQDIEIKKMLNNQVQLIKDVVRAEGAKFSENALFDALTLKDLRYLQLRDTTTVGLFFQEYNSVITEIYEKSEELRKLLGDGTNTDTNKKELTEAEKGEVAKLRQRLNELRVIKDGFTSGKRAAEFIATALYEAQAALHGHNRGYTWQEWAEKQSNKKFSELTEAEIKDLLPKYRAYRDTEMKNDVMGDARQFVNMVGLASKAIQDQQEYVNKMLTTGRDNAWKVQTMLGGVFDQLNEMASKDDFDVDAFVQNVQNRFVLHAGNTVDTLAIPFFDDEIKARLEYIEQAPETPDYDAKMKQRDKLYTIFEAFAKYSDTITNQFIDQGYIHPEVKRNLINTYEGIINTLTNGRLMEIALENAGEDADTPLTDKRGEAAFELLGRLSAYFGADADTVDMVRVDLNRPAMLQECINNMQEKINQLKELKHTPIVDLLERFKTATSDSTLSVKQILENVDNLLYQNFSDLSAFSFGEEIGKQLAEVDELLDVVASALYATRVDKASVNNSWGYSKTLNELNKKYGNDQWVELAEIEGETADLLQQDLALIKQKILLTRNLSSVNNGQKLNRQNKVGYNKQFIFFNKFKRLVNILPKELQGWDTSKLEAVLQQDLLLEKYNSAAWKNRRFGLTEDEKVRIEQESIMIDDAIYEFFQDNADKLNNIDELANFIDKSGFQLFDPATGLLSDEVDDLDDNQFIFSLAARAAVKGSSFYNTLRKTFNDERAPVPMQEQATYLNVAMVMQGDIINNFAKAYAKSAFRQFKNMSKVQQAESLARLGYSAGQISQYQNDPDSFQADNAVEKFANIVLTEGIAGSGKTRGVFDSTVKVVKQLKPELLEKVFVVNATLNNAEGLMSDLQLQGKAFSSSHSETEHDLIRYFYTNYTSDYKGKVRFVNNELVTDFTLKEDLTDLPKIIFIDEASRYDYVQMKLVSEAAQHYGITVLVAGDFDQISAESQILQKTKDGDAEISLGLTPNRLNFIRSSKQGVSFRSLNSQISKTQKEILAGLHQEDRDTFNIYYWENEKEIRGFKTHQSTDFDAIVASVEKIKKLLQPGEKLGYLYVNEDRSIHQKLQEKFGDLIEAKSIADAQGLESNYYILDFNTESDNATVTQRQRQELYTGVTRAKIGGIIINDVRNSQKLHINSIKEESSEVETITSQAITKASQKRAEILERVFKNRQVDDIAYKELTKVKKQPVVVPSQNPTDQDENLPPQVETSETTQIPQGTYRDRSEAEKVDLSKFVPGLELRDFDNNIIGIIQGTTIIEIPQDGVTYYAPAVVVQQPDGTLVQIYAEKLTNYVLKDPNTGQVTPKYSVGTVFYDSDNNPIKILSWNEWENVIEYQVEFADGHVKIIKESDLAQYSTIPLEKPQSRVLDDKGENEDPETYRRRIEGANGSELTQDIDSEGNIVHWMHTFNAYETGVLWVTDDKGVSTIDPRHFEQGNPMEVRRAARIDNVNGLLSLGVVGVNATKEQCVNILDEIHSELMYNQDNGDLIKNLSKILDPTGRHNISSIQYGIKSSAGVSKKSNSAYGTSDDSDPKFFIFDKHAEETIEYATPDVIAGDNISRKTVVAVFRNDAGEKVFEVTVGVLNSPITLGQRTTSDGKYIYEGVGEILEKLKPGMNGDEVFEICREAMKACDAHKPPYKDLKNLFKAFLMTSNAFAPLHTKKQEFNLARTRNFGPRVIQKKGDYQKDGTRQYETKYVDLSQFEKLNGRAIVSDIWIPKTNMFNGHLYPIHPGYPGVFVSYNKKHNKADLASIYMQQMDPNYKGVVDVAFYYIIPPEASVVEYVRNYRNQYLNKIDGRNRPVLPIGNLWTSYQLLSNLHKTTPITEESFKSKSLDNYELKDVLEYLNDLQRIEQRTNWEGDAEYEKFFEDYKKVYTGNETLAKKYAIRSTVLKKQDRILRSQFKDSKVAVYNVFSQYLSQAIFWGNDPNEKPNQERLAALTAANKHGIKYHVGYEGKGQLVGIFSPAATSRASKYGLDVMLKDGSIAVREFQINEKIDTPIFEIDALKTGVEILADWEFEDDSNPSKGKKFGEKLRNGTWGYINTQKPKPATTNFEKLKNNNKILFEEGGLFHGIDVVGENDPAYTEVDFAEQILTKFNAIPDNLGFAVVDASGQVKLHSFKISELPGNISQKENESPQGLGGITIGIPLMLMKGGDKLAFKTPLREYQVSLDGDELVFEYASTKPNIEKSEVQIVEDGLITQEIINEAIDSLPEGILKEALRSYNLNLTNLNSDEFKQGYELIKGCITDADLASSEAFKQLNNYILYGVQASVNVKAGDVVSDKSGSSYVVDRVEGTFVYVQNQDQPIDAYKETLYKNEDKGMIECIKSIRLKYGK